MATKTSKVPVQEWMYGVLRRPLVTEKSTLVSQFGTFAFEVEKDATKPQVRQAVEALYQVEVKRVNTTLRKGKVKRFKGVKGKRSDAKIAYITLKEGQTLDVSAGV